MRYSVPGPIGIGNLEATVRQLIDDLADHEVDEVMGLSLYFTPRSHGRRVEFRNDNGDVVDHIALEPVARKLYSGAANAIRAAEKRPNSELINEMMGTANSVRHLMQRWRLVEYDMAILLDSHPFRVNRLLNCDLQEMRGSERERLTTLLDIDRIYENVEQHSSIADWLRGGAKMEGYPGECPLEQLKLSDTTTMARLRDALRRAAAKDTALDVDGETEARIDSPARRPAGPPEFDKTRPRRRGASQQKDR